MTVNFGLNFLFDN